MNDPTGGTLLVLTLLMLGTTAGMLLYRGAYRETRKSLDDLIVRNHEWARLYHGQGIESARRAADNFQLRDELWRIVCMASSGVSPLIDTDEWCERELRQDVFVMLDWQWENMTTKERRSVSWIYAQVKRGLLKIERDGTGAMVARTANPPPEFSPCIQPKTRMLS